MKSIFLIVISSIFLYSVSSCSLRNIRTNEKEFNFETTPTTVKHISELLIEKFNDEDEKNQIQDSIFAPQKEIYDIGDIITIGDYLLVIIGWEEMPILPGYYEYGKFIGIEMLVVNNSENTGRFYYNLKLSDTNGEDYSVDPPLDYLVKEYIKYWGIPLVPGDKNRGTVVFTIPLESTPNQLTLKSSQDNYENRIVINLGKNPQKIDLPVSVTNQKSVNYSYLDQSFDVKHDNVQAKEYTLQIKEVIIDPTGYLNSKPEENHKFVYAAILTSEPDYEAYKGELETYLKDLDGHVFEGNSTALPSKSDCNHNNPFCAYHIYEIPENISDFSLVIIPDKSNESSIIPVIAGPDLEYFNDTNCENCYGCINSVVFISTERGRDSLEETVDVTDQNYLTYVKKLGIKQPTITINFNVENNNLLSLYSMELGEPVGILFNNNNNEGIKFTPLNNLSDGPYCIFYGEPFHKLKPAWCFIVSDD